MVEALEGSSGADIVVVVVVVMAVVVDSDVTPVELAVDVENTIVSDGAVGVLAF